jgi:glycosyltransferase involved in cell wall biosynthesis
VPLEIVCVSHNAPPLNDAEALCTARLLSALVAYGARVHLIAAEVTPTLDSDITAEILDPRVRVTYVRANSGRASRFAGMARYQYHGAHAEWMGSAIAVTRKVLKEYTKPILLSRACPWISNFVGYYCCDLAKAWVAHFSDPFPPHEWQDHWYSRLVRPINRRWARRILSRSDLVTITCPNAIRYIEQRSGLRFREKAEVVTHLALPKLKPGTFRIERKPDDFVVAHIGTLMMRRRPDLLLPGALMAMERHPQIRFLQYGHVDAGVLKLSNSSPAFDRLEIKHVENLSPRDAADLQAQVDVNMIVDTDLGLSYSPFILSKFPHSVCAGRPMLMLSAGDSEMARMTAKYGGGEFVPFSTPEAVAEAICRLYARRNEKINSARTTEYQAEFSVEAIVTPFFQQLTKLMNQE